MKLVLIIMITSAVIVLLMLVLNYSSYNGKAEVKKVDKQSF